MSEPRKRKVILIMESAILRSVQFKVLGPVEAIADGRVLRLGGSKQRTLLATLLSNANTPVSGHRLQEAVWGAAPPESARANVRSYVANLRRVLNSASGQERLTFGHRGYLLRVLPDELDLQLFYELAACGRSELAGNEPRAAAGHLRAALGLWRGSAFDGVAHNDSLTIEVTRLEEARLAAFENYADVCLELGEHEEVAGSLQALAAQHPLRESLWARLMTAQYRGNRPGDALKSYARVRTALHEDLGLEPGPELQRLQRAVLRGDPPLGTPPGPARHRPAITWPISQLPPDTADFVGRDAVMSQVTALLDPGGPRPTTVPVVILTGLPGVGKTALALRLAHRLRPAFPDGQLSVNLGGARGPAGTPDVILADLLLALGVAGSSIPGSTGARAAMFRSLLSGRRVLVLLDDARDEAQIRPLLPGTAACAVLVTSRSRLSAVAGAHLIGVPPLGDDESRALLHRIAGAQRFTSDPEATRQVLAGCAGLPLALRVTGAKLASRPHLCVRQLADRLADEQDRLAELEEGDLAVRGCFAASYQNLAPDAARAFRAIGMLPSPEFSPWVLAALLGVPDVGHVTDALLDANLVEVLGVTAHGEPGYRVHDLLHVFAAERALAEERPVWRRAAARRVLDGWITRVWAVGGHLLRVGTDDPALAVLGWAAADGNRPVTGVPGVRRPGPCDRHRSGAA